MECASDCKKCQTTIHVDKSPRFDVIELEQLDTGEHASEETEKVEVEPGKCSSCSTGFQFGLFQNSVRICWEAASEEGSHGSGSWAVNSEGSAYHCATHVSSVGGNQLRD